jgi:cytochrome c553
MRRLSTIILITLVVLACESTTISPYDPPDDHTIKQDGIMHKSGLYDPEENCITCHGEDLRGGITEVSCYECHGKKW